MSSKFRFEDEEVAGSGTNFIGIAGEDLTNRQLVRIGAAGTLVSADASVATTLPAIGITLAAASAGQHVLVLLKGWVGLSTWTWTAGGRLYASDVAGALTQTVGTLAQDVGVASSATQIWFDPQGMAGIGGPAGCPILEGATAYVGFDSCKEPFTNYFLCDGAADDVQINAALAYVAALGGGSVMLERGTYTLVDPIVFPGGSLTLRGVGIGTFIDGDALTTGNHGIILSAVTECTILDLAIQTEDGGAKTCHCIFIENGAVRFLIENVWIVASDVNGIHIEGTGIDYGRIQDCHVTGCDDNGIYATMDAANYLDYLTISHNDIWGNGDDGIEFAFRVRNALVKINQINGNTGLGVNISDATNVDNVVENNMLGGNTAGAINDGGTDTITPELNKAVENTNANVGRHPVAQMLDDVETTVRFGFTIPMDFQELVTAHVVIVSAAAGDLVWNAFADWGKICATEDYNTHSDSIGATTTAVLIDDLVCLDVSGALDIAALTPGDRVGMEFWRDGDNGSDTIGDTVYVSEVRLRYV